MREQVLYPLSHVTDGTFELMYRIMGYDDWWGVDGLSDEGKWFCAVVDGVHLFLTPEGVDFVKENWL